MSCNWWFILDLSLCKKYQKWVCLHKKNMCFQVAKHSQVCTGIQGLSLGRLSTYTVFTPPIVMDHNFWLHEMMVHHDSLSSCPYLPMFCYTKIEWSENWPDDSLKKLQEIMATRPKQGRMIALKLSSRSIRFMNVFKFYHVYRPMKYLPTNWQKISIQSHHGCG